MPTIGLCPPTPFICAVDTCAVPVTAVKIIAHAVHGFISHYANSCVRMLSAAAMGAFGGLCPRGGRKKLLPAVIAAKVKCLSIALRVESRGFVHGHAADGVFCVRNSFRHLIFPSPCWCIDVGCVSMWVVYRYVLSHSLSSPRLMLGSGRPVHSLHSLHRLSWPMPTHRSGSATAWVHVNL